MTQLAMSRTSGSNSSPTLLTAPRASVCRYNNTRVGSANFCTKTVTWTAYECNVAGWTAHVFVTLFVISTIVHCVQAALSKRWSLLGTLALCALLESIGWAGRWWSSSSQTWVPSEGGYWDSNKTAFLMQSIALAIAPAFLVVGLAIVLCCISETVGAQFSRFSSFFKMTVTLTGSVIAATLQGIGAALAATSRNRAPQNPLAKPIQMVGFGFQLMVLLLVFVELSEYSWRSSRDRPVKPFRVKKIQDSLVVTSPASGQAQEAHVKTLLWALRAGVALIFVRTVYRLVDLVKARTDLDQALFCALDGAAISLALAIYNFAHPLWLLPKSHSSSTGGSVAPERDTVEESVPRFSFPESVEQKQGRQLPSIDQPLYKQARRSSESRWTRPEPVDFGEDRDRLEWIQS